MTIRPLTPRLIPRQIVYDLAALGVALVLTTISTPAVANTATGPSLAPAPCQRPPDDYRLRNVNEQSVNARTLWMLRLAARLYVGPGSPLRVVQGSYSSGVVESFGTHAGGGAVDISIRAKRAPHGVLPLDEAEKMVAALRSAGFAAWLRMPDDLDPPTTLHIHAIAVGDAELSDAAWAQLYADYGYFAGYDGVPPEHGGTKADRHGGPVICEWMIDDGLIGFLGDRWCRL